MISPALKSYVKVHVFPRYAQNDPGHNLSHIENVIARLKKANNL